MRENNWWKSPVLQGPENDYGDLDYLLEELPCNTREWTKWQYKCSECGKWHRLNVVYTEYFYTLDGYDSLSTEVCWLCEMKSIIGRPFRKIKRKIGRAWRVLKETISLKRDLSKKHTWKKCYELAKILEK